MDCPARAAPALHVILHSVGRAAERAGVVVVTGDTKVVGRGSADKVFINTAGIGFPRPGSNLTAARVRPGDAILLFVANEGKLVAFVPEEAGRARGARTRRGPARCTRMALSSTSGKRGRTRGDARAPAGARLGLHRTRVGLPPRAGGDENAHRRSAGPRPPVRRGAPPYLLTLAQRGRACSVGAG